MDIIQTLLDLHSKTLVNFFPGRDKQPITAWKKYQSTRVTEFELKNIIEKYRDQINSIGILCGGEANIECIDIDNKDGTASEILKAFRKIDFFKKLYLEKTKNGGYHIIYSCDQISGNTVLARNKDRVSIVETRGIGGWVVTAPTPGYTTLQGSLLAIPHIPPEERAVLFSVAKSFDVELVVKDNVRPGDDFNEKCDMRQILSSCGWDFLGVSNGRELWRRPGKTENECSATWNPELRLFYNFSTNAYPLKPNEAYTPFRFLAIWKYGGNFSKCAQDLLKMGYGKNGDSPKSPFQIVPKSDPVLVATEYLRKTYDFRFNEVLSLVEYKKKEENKWERFLDRHRDAIWMELREMDVKISVSNLEQVINGKLAVNFHPFKTFFDSLPPWNGFDYIGDFLQCFETESREQLDKYFRKWIVGVVAQAIEAGRNDHCFTLVGKQGIGKTSIIGFLVPEELIPYYSVTNIAPANKDASILLAENFLINLDELETSTKIEIGHLKSLMSKPYIKIRRPYAHRHDVLLRHASFAASINHANFLVDPTGARRFFVVEVLNIYFPGPSFDVKPLYSQAYDMLKNGYKYWLSPNEVEEINETNEKFRIPMSEEEFIDMSFEPVDVPDIPPKDISHWCSLNGYQFLLASEILNELLDNFKVKTLSIRSLGLALQKLGFKRVASGSGRQYRYGYVVKRKNSILPSTTNWLQTHDEDEPF